MEQIVKDFYPFLSKLISLPQKKLWTDYDEEADTLYVSFGPPQKADDTLPGKNGVLIRKRQGKIIGFTIIGASKTLKD